MKNAVFISIPVFATSEHRRAPSSANSPVSIAAAEAEAEAEVIEDEPETNEEE